MSIWCAIYFIDILQNSWTLDKTSPKNTYIINYLTVTDLITGLINTLRHKILILKIIFWHFLSYARTNVWKKFLQTWLQLLKSLGTVAPSKEAVSQHELADEKAKYSVLISDSSGDRFVNYCGQFFFRPGASPIFKRQRRRCKILQRE
jgi:hypothetical protein